MLLVSLYIMAARRQQLMLFWLSLPTAGKRLMQLTEREFISNPLTTALSNPFRVGSRGWGTLVHQIHAAGEENGSIVVGMFVSLCLASKKSLEREFFVPTGTLLDVKLF